MESESQENKYFEKLEKVLYSLDVDQGVEKNIREGLCASGLDDEGIRLMMLREKLLASMDIVTARLRTKGYKYTLE